MSAPVRTVAAVDLGAASGRVMTGRVGPDLLGLAEVARFPNIPVTVGATLHWDVLSLYRSILEGLRQAGPVDSIGVDSWAIDYGLLDADGKLLGNPVHYRDTRTDGVMERVLREVPAEELYPATGLQLLPFNTIFQLVAARDTAQMAAARTLLLIPDLIGYWLTGQIGAERTNASTTQLLDVTDGKWSAQLATRLGIRPAILPPLREPGDRLGVLGKETGLGGVPVTTVASHDTASAVIGVPAQGQRFAYISCGTWSLAGVELDAPVLSQESRLANFTNEVGIDGTIRYLRNVMGLWLVQECQRVWGVDDVEPLLRAAAQVTPLRAVIDPNEPSFLAPGDMPARIGEACRRLGQSAPQTQAETVRCILDSLALAHMSTLDDAQRLSGRAVDVVHIVGGGARNDLLCQLTADACGLPVLAGPVEATALGNILVQARSLGAVGASLDDMRALVRATQPVRRFEPQGSQQVWREAALRLDRGGPDHSAARN
ncbi:carbohydrate kinase [Rhizocola hellebori]|uniref:Carbohydrate kinase n=1 Tax=Rhizocola hellebori TaxID=1392758 RepID=A0A8J3Q2F7_9ACTN|nr:rhamnulokinase family protein [Rhizocola hellebori]GIH02136.1 carbohydrate kinase [Rhizocola hellebori]